MRVPGQLRRFAGSLLIVLGSATIVAAQDHPPGLLGSRGARIDAEPTADDDAAPAPASPLRQRIELTRESQRFLRSTREDATLLASRSASAFQRGLLPLTDYLNQLALVEDVEVRAADLTGVRERVVVYRHLVEQLEDAWQRLEALRQPAAKGWQADTILAELALTEVRLKLAQARGDAGSLAALKSTSEFLAQEHFQQRQFDYRLGHASLPLMVYAAKLSASVSGAGEIGPQTASSSQKSNHEFLELVLAQTQAWSTMDAGVGRADRVTTARLDLDLDAFASTRDDPPVTRENLTQADDSFARLFDEQLEFHGHGTASVYDLAQTWVAWHDLHRAAATSLPEALDETQVARRSTALTKLESLAANVNDLRGRHAADVTYVRVAGQLDALDTLYVENQPKVEYLP